MKAVAAAFIFFTRLPLWRFKAFRVPAEYFKQVVSYWPLVGWLTAGVMVGVLRLSNLVFPYSVAITLAIVSRVLLTGALHEDGLTDFFDGFGGGRTKGRTLEIMKDSHIGTYGVLGLIFYFLLLHQLLAQVYLYLIIPVMLVADPLCKLISSFVVFFLPYARTEETSKAKVIYTKPALVPLVVSILAGLLPILFLPSCYFLLAILFPLATFVILVAMMKRRLQGYTGDCCGALFLLTELSFYLGVHVAMYIYLL